RMTDDSSGHVLAEEHYMRLHDARTLCAFGYDEVRDRRVVQLGIAIRRGCDVGGASKRAPAGVQVQESGLKVVACHDHVAGDAVHRGEGSMQLDDTAAAS